MDNNYIYSRVMARVDLDAVRENVQNIRNGLTPGTKTCAVIKADGYGHGAIPIARRLKDLVDFFAVATIDEALNLRLHNVKLPILILGLVHQSNTISAIRNDIRLTVSDTDYAEKIAEHARYIGKPVRVHIKIDTGMSRIGFAPDERSIDEIEKICRTEGIKAEGIFTHFYNADSGDLTSTYDQFEKFRWVIDELEKRGITFSIRHCSNSAAATLMPEANMDMVRLGISIYGLYPSEYVHQITLKPAMSIISHISMVKEIEPGTSVGYGATFTAERRTAVATVPVGYADGYFRSLSNKGYVLIHGQKAPIIGRICMDQFMVDVTDIAEVRNDDEVVLIGKSGEKEITMEELSELAGSFNYEFACDVGKRVPRVYYADGSEYATKDYFYDRY